MPRSVACAIVHGDPPQVFVADDQDTLNWVLALKLVAVIPGHLLESDLRDRLRTALRDEQWGMAVELWMRGRSNVDVYPSYETYTAEGVALAPMELDFTPLFED